jgi:hypothetical protein
MSTRNYITTPTSEVEEDSPFAFEPLSPFSSDEEDTNEEYKDRWETEITPDSKNETKELEEPEHTRFTPLGEETLTAPTITPAFPAFPTLTRLSRSAESSPRVHFAVSMPGTPQEPRGFDFFPQASYLQRRFWPESSRRGSSLSDITQETFE